MTNSNEHNIIMYTSIFVCMLQLVTGLRWVIESEYIIFGGVVLLNCDGTACSTNSIRKWIGGPHHNLLGFNVTSSYPSKYEMVVTDKSPIFGLKIKNFTNDDVNCKYTCACGLKQYTEMLDLDDVQYIYPPRIASNFSYTTGNEYDVDIVIAVYPLPTCYIEYEEAVIQVNYTSFQSTPPMFNESSYRFVRLYTFRIQHTLQKKKTNNCKVYLHLFCEVGSVNYTVLLENNIKCKDSNDSKEIMINIDILSVVVILVTTAFIILIFVLVIGLNVWICIRRRSPEDNLKGTKCCCEPLNSSTIHEEICLRSKFVQDASEGTKQHQEKLSPTVTSLLTEDE